MTRDQAVQLLRRAPRFGQFDPTEFADYVTPIERRKKDPTGRWVTDEKAYMSVDGRIAMAVADHAAQGKRLDFEPPQVLINDEIELTLLVTVISEIYGRRHGIATSYRTGGGIEAQHPWEIAETSATGRALAAMGYGLIPGSGLASAEDMERTESDDNGRASAPRAAGRLSARQRDYLVQAAVTALAVDERAATAALESLAQENLGHGLASLNADEARRLLEVVRTRAQAA